MSEGGLPMNETTERGSVRLASMSLKDARYILIAGALAIAAFAASGAIGWLSGALLYLIIALAAALPRRSRSMRLAARQKAPAMDWRQAIALPLQAMDEPAYLLRVDGTVKFQNEAAEALFGVSEPNTHLSGRIRSPAILGMVQQAMEDDEPRSVDHSERVPSERWFQVRCAPIAGAPARDHSGKLYLLTFRDMTEARRMDRMRSDFVANASHELRTPLASLTGFIETIKGPAKNDRDAQARFLDIMYEQATRMTRLVDDLMSLSRLEMKTHVAPTDRVDLNRLVAHVTDSMKPLAAEMGVTVALTVPDERVVIQGDRDELIQVLQNLIENACKYGQSGGRVDVAVDVLPTDEGYGSAELRVRDYGPGIAPEHVPRLTERFYRVDIESSRSKRGTGLGLAIVKHILTRHRTRLVVQSTLGEGTTFIVRFERQKTPNDVVLRLIDKDKQGLRVS
jgi:two-component system, OmpR family, phosphate regulon sensor histidine kinase PhoR